MRWLLEVVAKVAREEREFNFRHPTFCAGTRARFGVESLGCTTSRSSTIRSGKTSSRSCLRQAALAGHEPMTGWFWKASYGCCAAARAGAICRSDILARAPAGDDCATGKRKISGSISGDSFSLSWIPRAGSTGTKCSWTAASPRPKKGALRG